MQQESGCRAQSAADQRRQQQLILTSEKEIHGCNWFSICHRGYKRPRWVSSLVLHLILKAGLFHLLWGLICVSYYGAFVSRGPALLSRERLDEAALLEQDWHYMMAPSLWYWKQTSRCFSLTHSVNARELSCGEQTLSEAKEVFTICCRERRQDKSIGTKLAQPEQSSHLLWKLC